MKLNTFGFCSSYILEPTQAGQVGQKFIISAPKWYTFISYNFGATEQNLLKLFEWLISNTASDVIKLPTATSAESSIIY